MPTHALKTVQPYYGDIEKGIKTFEVRKNGDRVFKVGDKLLLQEFDPEKGYTGKEWEGEITYLMTDSDYVKKGFVIFGIKRKNDYDE